MAIPFGRRIRPINQALYAIPGNIAFTVPNDVYSVTCFLRGGGGGAGGGSTGSSYDGYSPGAGGAGYSIEQTIPATPGQVISGTVGRGGVGGAFFSGIGAAGNGGSGGTTTFGGLSATGGGGGTGALSRQYIQRAGGVGSYNGSAGGCVFSEYYLGGNGAGTSEDGYIVFVNGVGCQASRGGHSYVTHPNYRIQQFPQGHTGSNSSYTYSAQFTAYYGWGGGGGGDLGNGSGWPSLRGGLGGGGGAGYYAISGGEGGDGYILLNWEAGPYTVTQLPLDGANGGVTFADTTGKTWTLSGNAQLSTVQSVSGGSSAVFDGSGDRISCTHADFALGTVDITIHFWMRPTNFNSVYQRLIQIGPNSTAGGLWIVEVRDQPGSIFVQTHTGTGYYNVFEPTPAGTVPLNQWSHVAVTRQAGTWRLFVNGVLQATRVNALGNNITQTAAYIGSNHVDSESYSGYLDNIQIIRGVSLYNTNFTPPTTL